MNYYGAKEMAESWRTVRKNTIQVAEDIPEDKYSFRAAPDTMSVAEILSHLAVTPLLGAAVPLRREEDRRSRWKTSASGWVQSTGMPTTLTSKAAIVDALKKNGEQFASQIEGHERRAARRDRSPLPMGSKTRFEMLLGVKEHEMHHRAQLFLIERLLGIVPHLTRARQAAHGRARVERVFGPACMHELLCAGEAFEDLIFVGLDRLPELGEEVKTDHFTATVGGGAVITAVTAARLGMKHAR